MALFRNLQNKLGPEDPPKEPLYGGFPISQFIPVKSGYKDQYMYKNPRYIGKGNRTVDNLNDPSLDEYITPDSQEFAALDRLHSEWNRYQKINAKPNTSSVATPADNGGQKLLNYFTNAAMGGNAGTLTSAVTSTNNLAPVVGSKPLVTGSAPVTTTSVASGGTKTKKKPLAQTKNNAIAEDFNSEMLRNPNATQYGWNENGITENTPIPIEEEKQVPLAPYINLNENGEVVNVPQETKLESGVIIPKGNYSKEGIRDIVANQAENGIGDVAAQITEPEVINTKSDLELAIDDLLKSSNQMNKDKKIALAGKYGKDSLMTMLEFIRNEKQKLPEDVPTPVMRTPDLIDTTNADQVMLRKKEAEGISAIREMSNVTGNREMVGAASASLNSDVMNNVITLAKQKQANMNTQRTIETDILNKNNLAASETKKLNLERIGIANDKTGATRSQLLSQFGKMDTDYMVNKFKLRGQEQNQKVFKLLLDQYRAHAGEKAYLDLIAQWVLDGKISERTTVVPNSAAAQEKQDGGGN